MRRPAYSLLAIAAFVSAQAVSADLAEQPPAWAYPVNTANLNASPDDGAPQRVPGSTVSYTASQIHDRFNSPVWHPEDQPPLPEVVAHGRKPDVFACAWCHRSAALGGPDNANLAGLPASYIVQQMADFRSGARTTSVPKRNIQGMIAVAKGATDEEVRIAADYLSALKPTPVIRVVESETAPKTRVVDWHLAVESGAGTEPLARRIIEVPEDTEQYDNRDSRARFIAYVPPGSMQRGQQIAATGGGGKTQQCAACHGPGLKGLGPVPRLAGLSPTYVFRQLYDFRSGARAGASSAAMRPVVENLGVDDMIALSAYVSSLSP